MLLKITATASLILVGAACESRETVTIIKNTLPNLTLPPSWKKVTSPATAVLSYDSVEYKVFPGAQAVKLSKQEVRRTEHLLAACIKADNQRRKRAFLRRFHRESIDQGLLIDLSNYNRQLIPVLNKQGEKEVWVRCFCNVPPDWRTRFLVVKDGGNCYFSVKVNLTKSSWYEVMINGEA